MIVLGVGARIAKQPLADKQSADVVEQQAHSAGNAIGAGQGHHYTTMVHEQ